MCLLERLVFDGQTWQTAFRLACRSIVREHRLTQIIDFSSTKQYDLCSIHSVYVFLYSARFRNETCQLLVATLARLSVRLCSTVKLSLTCADGILYGMSQQGENLFTYDVRGSRE